MKNCENYDNTNMVLRYYIGLENHEKRFEILVDFLKRTGIRRVLLFSAPFVRVSSILPEEYYKNHANMLRGYAEKLREINVDVGINMLYTLGHHYYADEEEFGFKRAVTVNGEPSRGCVCPIQDDFKEYVKRIYGYYARLKPSNIYCDDDIRGVSLGQLICLCDKHIEEISARVGKPLTREEIRQAVYSDEFETNEIKKAFFDQMSEDIEDVILTATEGVHAISPETTMGIMLTAYPEVTVDRNLKEFFYRNYDKKITGVRPGMNFYREGEAKDIPLMFSMPAIQRNLIDDDRVEFQPEIENDYYGFFWKSNSVTHMQLVWCLTNGFRNLQLNLFNYSDTHLDNYEEIVGLFEKRMNFYNKLAQLIPLNKRASGINIYANEKALYHRRVKDEQLFFFAEWYKYLNCDGIPVGYDKSSTYPVFLTGDDVLGATEVEIDQMLSQGAIIDLRAAESLVYKGFGDRIGIEKIEKISKPFAGEVFTDNDLNGIYKEYDNSEYFVPSLLGTELVKSITYKKGVTVLSEVVDHYRNRLCDGVSVFENAQGERFCIIPTDHNVFSQFSHINNKRKTQLINVIEWIAGKELPVYACNEMVSVNINQFDTYNVISLFNLTSDDVKNLKIAYRPENTLYYLNEAGTLRKLKYTKDGRFLTIDKNLKAKGVLIIVDKKIKE